LIWQQVVKSVVLLVCAETSPTAVAKTTSSAESIMVLGWTTDPRREIEMSAPFKIVSKVNCMVCRRPRKRWGPSEAEPWKSAGRKVAAWTFAHQHVGSSYRAIEGDAMQQQLASKLLLVIARESTATATVFDGAAKVEMKVGLG